MSTYELNHQLLEAAEKGDIDRVEALLKQGADPLGSSDETDPDEHILGELFGFISDDPELGEKMAEIVQLFLDYGMDIGARSFRDDGDDINPLWELAFCPYEHGLKILRVLLDGGLDHVSAEILVEHILIDAQIYDCDLQDDWSRDRTVCHFKMIMLASSYPRIIDESAYIRDCIELQNNRRENLPAFRDWNAFDYRIDIPHAPPRRGLRDASVTIRGKISGNIVWTLHI